MSKFLSVLFLFTGALLAVAAVYIYLRADQGGQTGNLQEMLSAAGLMIAGLLFVVIGKRLRALHEVQQAITEITSDDRPENSVGAVAEYVRGAAPSAIPVKEAGPCLRFRPVLSPTAQQSWLGGEPEMDDTLDWPHSGDTPMAFIAQIHCRDMPGNTCQGLLPEDGWLVFFYAGGYEPNARVLHTQSRARRFATPDKQPEGHLFLAPYRLIDPPKAAPRVFVEPVSGELDAEAFFDEERRDEADQMVAARIAAWQDAFDLQIPAYQPFDGVSARALVMSAHRPLVPSRSINPANLDDDRRKMLEARIASRPAFEAAFVRELAAEGGADRDRVVGSELVSRLEDFGISHDETALDLANRMHGTYLEAFSWHARKKAFDDGAGIPAEVHDAIVPVWQAQLEVMPVTVGGRGTERTRSVLRDYGIGVPPEEAICLLMLTTTSFMGWNFGDASDLGFYIAPDALSSRGWDKVVGVDTHGV